MEASEPTVVDSESEKATPTAFDLVPASVFADADEDNRRRDFTLAIVEARTPPPEPEQVKQPIPKALAEQTRLEMEAGAKRVAEFAANERERQDAMERHKRDKWQARNNEEIFRPGEYVPDQKKNQGHVGGQSANV